DRGRSWADPSARVAGTPSATRAPAPQEMNRMTTTPPPPERLYDAYLFDLDGTIYLGEELLPGAREVLTELRERGIPVRFLSNNPTKSAHEYSDKLTRLGIPTPVTEITSTVGATTRWLLTHHPGATVFPVAE